MNKKKSNKPLFSIITCTKNSEKYIKNNLISTKQQTCDKYEHIFIDGKSTDKTIDLLKSYKKNNSSNVKIYSIDPIGISSAMNEGIKKSSGKYIFILHGDDSFYNKDILKKTADHLTLHPTLDWIYGKICVVEENGKDVVGYFPKHWFLKNSFKYFLKFFNFIPHQAVFMKREVFFKHGFFKKHLTSSMDYDLWLRVNYKTNWKFFDKTISKYRIHKGAQSSGQKNIERNFKNLSNVQRKYYYNYPEYLISKILNLFFKKINKTTR